VAKVGKFGKEGKGGIMERWKDGKIRQFENSAIRQWKSGMLECWNVEVLAEIPFRREWKIGRLEK